MVLEGPVESGQTLHWASPVDGSSTVAPACPFRLEPPRRPIVHSECQATSVMELTAVLDHVEMAAAQ